jgi:phosphoglycolate phosphatase-like HAD superfamily hydrolase
VITNGTGKPVVALDIDGTLGDYHGNFLSFAEKYFGRLFPSPQIPNPGYPLWRHMGIEQHAYREAKLAYRQGGWKRWMPTYPMASGLTGAIRAAGAEVWLCTTRPYLRLDNVDPDTREWLRRNEIAYDAVLFDPLQEGETKYHELYRQAGERIASVIDDLPEMVEAADYLRIPKLSAAILRDQPYNQHVVTSRRAMDLSQAWDYIQTDLRRWREEYE